HFGARLHHEEAVGLWNLDAAIENLFPLHVPLKDKTVLQYHQALVSRGQRGKGREDACEEAHPKAKTRKLARTGTIYASRVVEATIHRHDSHSLVTGSRESRKEACAAFILPAFQAPSSCQLNRGANVRTI